MENRLVVSKGVRAELGADGDECVVVPSVLDDATSAHFRFDAQVGTLSVFHRYQNGLCVGKWSCSLLWRVRELTSWICV